MSRLIRKQTRIRMFFFFVTALYCAAFSFLLWRQRLSNDAKLDAIRVDFDSRYRSLVSSSPTASSSVSDPSDSESSVSDFPALDSEPSVPRFIVLGHGRASRWGFIDIQYVSDGVVDRFYYNADTLCRIPDAIELRCFRHDNGLIPYTSDSSRTTEATFSNSLDFQ